ncbi:MULTISPECIES: hypothetical protein [Brevibacillus]|uniref:hypothetical protein n=1 Tax=Brevibacillus TaxID=55080 RepID=UPI00363BB298
MANAINREDLPEVMEVRHVREFLGLGHVQAYDFGQFGKIPYCSCWATNKNTQKELLGMVRGLQAGLINPAFFVAI